MAGFAIFMSILMYGSILLVSTAILSAVFYFVAKGLAEYRTFDKDVVSASAFTPFLALGWLVASLLIHILVSNGLAHQDCGFSADPYVTLPNGYVLGSANTYDGYIHAPDSQTDVPSTGNGYVRGVIDIVFANGVFHGTYFDLKTSNVRRFTLDPKTKMVQTSAASSDPPSEFESGNSKNMDKWAQAQTSVHEDPNAYWKMYEHYRHRWPNYILFGVLILGETAIGLRLLRLWRRSAPPAEVENEATAEGPLSSGS